MQKETNPHATPAIHMILCSPKTKDAAKKNIIVHIVGFLFSMLAVFWLSEYPKTIWLIGLTVFIGLSALTELFQCYVFLRTLHTSIILSSDSAILKRFGTETMILQWDELAFVGKANVKQSSILREAPYIVLSKSQPERVDDTSASVRVNPKESILIEDTNENWELIKCYYSNTENQ